VDTPEDRRVDVGTISTRYWVDGSQGPPVVLIHGIGASIEDWLPTVGALASSHRVYAVDLPGHGLADKPLDISYTIPDMAGFVRGFMAALDIEHAHVIGHSLGGAIATQLALGFPEVVDKLVLVSSAGLGRGIHPMFRLASVPVLGERLTRPSRQGVDRLGEVAVHDPSVLTPEMRDFRYRMSAQPNAQQCFLNVLRANGVTVLGQSAKVYKATIPRLASFTNPVLVVWGREDQLVPVAHAQVAVSGFPNAQVCLLDDCGHLPMLEHPDAFNDAVLGFLKA
jgi:pimeloyl-ACP methyl ester carboxylesterase